MISGTPRIVQAPCLRPGSSTCASRPFACGLRPCICCLVWAVCCLSPPWSLCSFTTRRRRNVPTRCGGGPDVQGDQDSDPLSNTDCMSTSSTLLSALNILSGGAPITSVQHQWRAGGLQLRWWRRRFRPLRRWRGRSGSAAVLAAGGGASPPSGLRPQRHRAGCGRRPVSCADRPAPARWRLRRPGRTRG